MVLQTIFEPVIFGIESDQDSGRFAMSSDDDLLGGSQAQIAREIVFDLRQCDLTAWLARAP